MSGETTEEIAMLRRTVRGFLLNSLRPHEAAVDAADDAPPALMQQLRLEALQLGLYGYNMPEALGGPGLGRLGSVRISMLTGSGF